MPSNLIYLVSFDPLGVRGARSMAKLLVSSLLRTLCDCTIVVFRNYPEPLYVVPRADLEEIYVETPKWYYDSDEDLEECLVEALAWRFRAHEFIDPAGYEFVTYLDCDCLALRNLDHLFSHAPEVEVLIQRERGRKIQDPVFSGYLSDPEMEELNLDGVNAGTIAVRGHCFHSFMSQWQEIYESHPEQHDRFRDQTALNRLLLDSDWQTAPFEKGEITFPFHLDPRYQDFRDSALVHFVGESQERKIDLAWGLYMSAFQNDGSGIFLDFLEI